MASLASVGVDLDPDMTMLADGVVAVATVPESPEHREWMRSAVHMALHDDLHSTFTVLVPPAAATKEEAEERAEHLALRAFATTVYKQVVSAYPWRDRALMAARIPSLVDHILAQTKRGKHHPVFMGNVDDILPACDDRVLFDEVALVCGRMPLTRYEWFQTIHLFQDATPRIRAAAEALFVL